MKNLLKNNRSMIIIDLFLFMVMALAILAMVVNKPVDAAPGIQTPPPYANASTDQWADRRAYDGSDRLLYVGECLPQYQNQGNTEKWRIKKYYYDGATTRITSIIWADHVATFSKAWNSRTTYTY